MQQQLLVKKLSDKAVLPQRATPQSAGYDLSAAADVVVKAHGKALVPTDLAIALPPNVYGRIAPRSSLAWKKHIDVGAGVIDRDYRGAVGVVLFNLSSHDFVVRQGDRIAQMILERYEEAEVVQVDALPESQRGDGGFGSTGTGASPSDKRPGQL